MSAEAARLGRPPVDFDQRRTESIVALFTSDEKIRVFQAAAARGLTVSVYVRRVLMASMEPTT